ncbi:hypothetical protein KKF63_10220, partial [bacterium]|nr:hypothetical protein [bacterium]
DSIRDELEEEMGESFDSCGSFDGFWDAVWFFDEAWDAIGCVLDYLANAAVWLSTHVIEGVSDTLSGITDVMNFTEFLVSAHDGDGETTRYLFKRVDADNGVYWALTAARYHHHNTVSTKYHGDIPWPLRIHISKNKHAQYPSKWVCENATYADGAEPEVLERLEGADEFNNTYEDCDGWHLNEDLSYPVEGDNGGEVLYPEDYALNDLDEDFTSYTGDFCNAGGRDVGIEEDCDLNTDLVTSGMVFLDHWESGEQEEVDVGDDDPDPYDPLDMNPQNIFSYGQSDYHGSYNDINLYSYYLQSGSNLTARTADSITVSDFIVGNGASVSLKYGTNGGDRVVLSPFFWAQEGSELTISSSTYFPFK